MVGVSNAFSVLVHNETRRCFDEVPAFLAPLRCSEASYLHRFAAAIAIIVIIVVIVMLFITIASLYP